MAVPHATTSSACTERSEAPTAERARVALRLTIVEPPERWLLEEDDVPESPLHKAIIDVLILVLKQWAQREGRSVLVAGNLACRWDPSDARIGTAPDIVLLEPPPPGGENLASLRVWEPGHPAPRVAVEVVSDATASKDYLDAPTRCARLGVRELWVFDPLLRGPTDGGGPYLLQVWRRSGEGPQMDRIHAGPAPARSEELGAYLVVTEGGTRLRLSDDPSGQCLWPTGEEAALAVAEEQRAQAEEQRARAEEQRARAEAAETELARLRALLRERM